MALAILAVALGTLVGSLFWALRIEEGNEETVTASQLVRARLETLQQMGIANLYAAYNGDPSDDPDPNHDYPADLRVDDELLVAGKKGAPAVTLTFPGDPVAELAENRLTVALRIEWEGTAGPRSVERTTILRDP
jgi:hypothetical protein